MRPSRCDKMKGVGGKKTKNLVPLMFLSTKDVYDVQSLLQFTI